MKVKKLKVILRYIAIVVFSIWVLLSLVVLFFIIDKWQNPINKGISIKDFYDYLKISGIFWGIVIIVKIILYLMQVKKKDKL